MQSFIDSIIERTLAQIEIETAFEAVDEAIKAIDQFIAAEVEGLPD
jgi:hypothetical protein